MGNKPVKVLLIEDSVFATRHTQKMLAAAKSSQFDAKLKCTGRLSEGLELMDKGGIDIVLLDLTLPDSNELDTFTKVHSHAPELPIVVMSGIEDEALTIEAVQKGAQDYLVKGQVDSNLLKRSILYAIERKRTEEELRKHREHLKDANIRLKELDRLKSMFIASMNHELRTPLNSIIGLTRIILQGISGEITEVQRKELTIVKNSADHLLALISDVIDVSKIEADQIELAIEEFDLAELIQEVRDSFKVAVDEKGLKMSLETPERLIIKSDRRRAKQVIINLVSNAIKFTDKGKIAIKAAKKDEGVEVSVNDTGIGIKKENMKKLFKQFSRIYIEHRTRAEGTGLGLYLSKKIAGLLGGEIEAKSEFGKGSKFTFTLPLKYKGAKT